MANARSYRERSGRAVASCYVRSSDTDGKDPGSRHRVNLYQGILAAAFALSIAPPPAAAVTSESVASTVSVLPVWPGRPAPSSAAEPGRAPEGSGVAVTRRGLIATAWHVVEPATRIDVRLADGRILQARLVGHDAATDIALLEVDAELPVFEWAERPAVADPVCAIGNAYGLGLSVTCGVVSALDVTRAGFNPIEHFVQTDAAANPGSSGGALVDAEGRLVGMVSAIFAGGADTNIGVNFAVSSVLLQRVVDDLLDDGRVDYVDAGWRVAPLARSEHAKLVGVRAVAMVPGGPADAAGLRAGDVIVRIDRRMIRSVEDSVAALALVRAGGNSALEIDRDGDRLTLTLRFGHQRLPEARLDSEAVDPTCPHPTAVCAARGAVFPVSAFDPLGSAVRIGPDLVVASRHVIGEDEEITLATPGGLRAAEIVPSSYRGDLVLLRVADLVEGGETFDLTQEPADLDGLLFAVGADAARQEVRVFEPGRLVLGPAADAIQPRLHVTAEMQNGVSGGALVDGEGRLAGLVAGGGEGRNEAIPLAEVQELVEGTGAGDAAAVQASLGQSFVECAGHLDEAAALGPREPLPQPSIIMLIDACRASENVGLFLEAGRTLAGLGRLEDSLAFFDAAVVHVPHSLNARLSLLTGLQFAGHFAEMLPHVRWLIELLPNDAQVLRLAVQAGVWGGDPPLAETAHALMVDADLAEARAARQFIDRAPPAPPRR